MSRIKPPPSELAPARTHTPMRSMRMLQAVRAPDTAPARTAPNSNTIGKLTLAALGSPSVNRELKKDCSTSMVSPREDDALDCTLICGD